MDFWKSKVSVESYRAINSSFLPPRSLLCISPFSVQSSLIIIPWHMSLFHGWAPASPIKVCWSRVRLVAKRWRFAMLTRACVECKTLTFLLVMDESRLFLVPSSPPPIRTALSPPTNYSLSFRNHLNTMHRFLVHPIWNYVAWLKKTLQHAFVNLVYGAWQGRSNGWEKETERKLMMVKLLPIKQPLNRDCPRCESEYGGVGRRRRKRHHIAAAPRNRWCYWSCVVKFTSDYCYNDRKPDCESSLVGILATCHTMDTGSGQGKFKTVLMWRRRWRYPFFSMLLLELNYLLNVSPILVRPLLLLHLEIYFHSIHCKYESSGKCGTKWDANNFLQMTFFCTRWIDGRFLELAFHCTRVPLESQLGVFGSEPPVNVVTRSAHENR